MNSLLFIIILTTVILLHAGIAIDLTNLHDFVKVLRSQDTSEERYDDSIYPYKFKNENNTITMFTPDSESDAENNTYDDDNAERMKLLRNEDLSDEVLKGDSSKTETSSKEDTVLRNGNGCNGVTTTKGPRTRTKRKKLTTAPPTGMDAWSEAKLQAHQRRLKEINEHMAKYFTSTLYLYNEVRRIMLEHTVMDELRLMAVDLEHPNNQWIKGEVAKCFRIFHPDDKFKPMWRLKTNQLVVNYVKDPLNDAVIN